VEVGRTAGAVIVAEVALGIVLAVLSAPGWLYPVAAVVVAIVAARLVRRQLRGGRDPHRG
jgi:hypothetical protein